jgi:hypothetical protein
MQGKVVLFPVPHPPSSSLLHQLWFQTVVRRLKGAIYFTHRPIYSSLASTGSATKCLVSASRCRNICHLQSLASLRSVGFSRNVVASHTAGCYFLDSPLSVVALSQFADNNGGRELLTLSHGPGWRIISSNFVRNNLGGTTYGLLCFLGSFSLVLSRCAILGNIHTIPTIYVSHAAVTLTKRPIPLSPFF